jgi:DNA-binding MarR family transcriptional regulator
VAGLAAEGLLTRTISDQDRRAENLSLTPEGRAVYVKIGQSALEFDADLRARLGSDVADRFDRILRDLIALQAHRATTEDD